LNLMLCYFDAEFLLFDVL